MSMIFQEPMTSLNPVHTIGAADRRRHPRPHPALAAEGQGARDRDARAGAHPLGRGAVRRLPAPAVGRHAPARDDRHGARPASPTLLIADEPTTALDVTIQAQILELLSDLRKRLGMAMLLITHDLGVIAEVADDVVVMYAGKIVESAPVARAVRRSAASLHDRPAGLDPAPRRRPRAALDHRGHGARRRPPAQGCRFSPRCPFADSALRRRAAAAARHRPGPQGRLLESTRGARGMSEHAPSCRSQSLK